MPVRPKNSSYASALSWRSYAQRFSFVFVLLAALGLLIMGQSKPQLAEQFRLRLVDSLAPVLDALSRPLEFTSNVAADISSYFNLRQENLRLKAANQQMAQWQNAALTLEYENRELRSLLRYKPEPNLSYISARAIADAGGAYARSLLVTAGSQDGVREGMAAMTGEGLIGRIVEVGEWSSRILLITDLNSRIPVMLTESGDHAILSGDNAQQLKLNYLPQDSAVKPGDRVVTSGHGGLFPPNLPVGTVSSEAKGDILVTPLAAMGRINQVRLVDFTLKGGTLNSFATQLQAGASKR